MEVRMASKQQTWALFCITKKDYRNAGLTYEQASKLIEEFNKNKPAATAPKKASTLKAYMTSPEVIKELTEFMAKEMGIVGIVENDTRFMKPGPRYVFLGGGCGFSFIKFDGRSQKAKLIVEQSGAIKRDVESLIAKHLGKEFGAKLQALGNPLGAHFMQNLNYNAKYNSIIVRYMESVGIKKAWVDNRLD